MATLFTTCSSLLLVSFIIVFCVPLTVNSTEFEVGGDDGWVVPTSKNDDQIYNQWASQNRFKVDDTLRFKYSKDSVMVVSKEEYESCRSSKPLFFSNNGDTLYELDHPGLFYFISGVSGHCDRGQKMIVKVLAIHDNPQPQPKVHSESPTSAPAPAPSLSHHHSQAARSIPPFSITNFPLFLIFLPFAMFFV